jgi:hypothetical protein
VISWDDYWGDSGYLSVVRSGLGQMFSYYFDPSVPMINEIMFTFYQQFMYVQEVLSGETWFWTQSNFQTSSRTLKYYYQDQVGIMIANEFMDRIGMMVKTFVVFGLISCVTSLAIRLILKASSVMIL